MNYNEILQAARTCMGPYCKACPVCDGKACRNTIPGPGSKGLGVTFQRNYQKWQELCVQMDTICDNLLRFLRREAAPAGAGRPRGRHENALRRQI